MPDTLELPLHSKACCIVPFQLSASPIIPSIPHFQPEEGAEVQFIGTVRGSEDGHPITGIDYSVYRPMAEKTLEDLLARGQTDHGPHRAFIQHRLGFVAAEESIFLWAKAMGYRGEKLKKPSSTVGKLEVFSYLDGAVIHYKALGEAHGAAGAIDETTLLRFLENKR